MAHHSTEGPCYYKRGDIDVWDFIRDQGLSFHLGNAIKYVCRAGYKGTAEEDLKKAIHYLENELHHVTSRQSRVIPLSVQAQARAASTWPSEEFDR